MPPRGPGTAPRTRISSRSASAWTTSRFSVVTWCPPMRPAMRVPLKTRAGVAQAPMDPGERCFLWLPWAAPWPLKLWRFMAPAKPLPLDTAMASTRSPGSMTSAVSCWPTSKPLASSMRSSTRCRPGSTPAAAKWPCSGLVRVRGPAHAPGDLQGGVALALGRLHLHHPHGRDLQHRHRDGAVAARPRPGSCRPSRRRSPWSPRLGGVLPSSVLEPAAQAAGRLVLGTVTAPGSHANAPPGKPERSARQVVPRGPHRHSRQALGDVETAYWARNRPDLRRYTIGSWLAN